MACAWPAGHDSPHGERPTPPAQRASEQARRLADRVEQISQRLGWLAADVDTDIALRGRVNGDDRLSLDDLAMDLQRVSVEASDLATDVQTIGSEILVARPASRPTELTETRSLSPTHRPPPDGGLGL